MAEGGDRYEMPSKDQAKPILDELIRKRMHRDEIEDLFQMFLELCGDERKLMINFLKIFMATIPEAAIRDVLVVDHANIVFGYDVDQMLDDLKELNNMFFEDDEWQLKTYLINFKMFVSEMLHSETVSTVFQQNRQMLAVLNTMLRLMCISEYIRQRQVAIIAMFEMLTWLLENQDQHNDQRVTRPNSDEYDSLRMELDTPATSLAYMKACALQCISLPLIIEPHHMIRLSVLNYIREHCKKYVDMVKDAGILKGLAHCIMDSSLKVQLACVELLLDMLENSIHPELIDWFYDECQISLNCTAVPVNLLIDNLSPKASADFINTSMKILIYLEKHCPGRITLTGVKFLLTNLCSSDMETVKLVAEFLHTLLCGLTATSHLTGYEHYKKYMGYFVKLLLSVSKAIPIDLFVNPWMGNPDSPLLNFEYFVKYLLEEGVFGENVGSRLLTVLRSVVCQLKGFFQPKVAQFTKDMLINDMSTDDRMNKLVSFVINFAKYIDGLLKHWEDVKEDCLNISLNIVIHIPAVYLTEKSFLKYLHAMIEKILLNETFNLKERQRAMKAVAHVSSADAPICKNIVTEVIGNVLELFEASVYRLADVTESLNSGLHRKVLADCQNMLALSDHFDLTPALEEINRREIVIMLSKFLMAEQNSNEAKMHVMRVRHLLLVADINLTIESFTKHHDRNQYRQPLDEFEKCVDTYMADICKMNNILNGWLGNLEEKEQVDMLEIIKKEQDILHVLRQFDSDRS